MNVSVEWTKTGHHLIEFPIYHYTVKVQVTDGYPPIYGKEKMVDEWVKVFDGDTDVTNRFFMGGVAKPTAANIATAIDLIVYIMTKEGFPKEAA